MFSRIDRPLELKRSVIAPCEGLDQTKRGNRISDCTSVALSAFSTGRSRREEIPFRISRLKEFLVSNR